MELNEDAIALSATTAQPPTTKTVLLTGCFLAISGNLLISVSLNLQKYIHKKVESEQKEGDHYLKYKIWWLAISFMALGELGNFSAYGLTPASVVAPLGTTTVIANSFIAVTFLKEKLRVIDVIGCILAITGAILLVVFTQAGERFIDSSELIYYLMGLSFIVYVVLELLILGSLCCLRYFGISHVVIPLLICAILASFTVISAKAVSSMIQATIRNISPVNIFTQPIFYVMLVVLIATAVLQVKFLNIAMRYYNATTVVPTHFVFFTMSAIIAGVVFYQELNGLEPLNIAMFLLGCVLCFLGVFLITYRPNVLAEELSRLGGPSEASFSSQRPVIPCILTASAGSIDMTPPDAGGYRCHGTGAIMSADSDPILASLTSSVGSQEALIPSYGTNS